MSSSVSCLHSADSFRYVCEFYIGVRQIKHGIKVSSKEMFYLTTHSTHFIYGYIASLGIKTNHWF